MNSNVRLRFLDHINFSHTHSVLKLKKCSYCTLRDSCKCHSFARSVVLYLRLRRRFETAAMAWTRGTAPFLHVNVNLLFITEKTGIYCHTFEAFPVDLWKWKRIFNKTVFNAFRFMLCGTSWNILNVLVIFSIYCGEKATKING